MNMLASSSEEAQDIQPFLMGTNTLSDSETIASGQTIAAFTPLGRVTLTGLLVAALAGASDGSEKVIAISAHAVDASAGAQSAPVYKGGVFNADLITWDVSWNAAAIAGAFDGTPMITQLPG
jgi:hypothetical protein